MRPTPTQTPTLTLALALLLSACGPKATPSPTATPAVTPTPSARVRTFEALWSAVNENYVYADFNNVDWQAVYDEYLPKVQAASSAEEFAEAIHAMVAELPAGSVTWESREERIEAQTTDASTYEGIGAYISFRASPQPHVVLLAIIEGSPAEAAGLAAHDSLVAIDGEPVHAEEGLDVVNRVRGPAGSDVVLTVQTPGEAPREVTVTRGRLAAADRLKLGILRSTNIGYMLVPVAPYDGLADEVVGSLQALNTESPLGGLILDLRIAHGGGNWPLGELLTMFGNGEDLGEIYSRTESNVIQIEGQDFANSQRLPLVILVGPDTAGPAEMLAAALQAIGRATVVGLPTLGEIEIPTEYPLPDGSRAWIAATSYRTPDGREIGLTGVQPDVQLPADWDAITENDDPVRDAAVEILGNQ